MGYSAAELRKLAIDAGVPQAGTAEINLYGTNDLPYLMAAVAEAESGGNPKAHNAKPPDDSYGLWQINMKGKLGPDRRAKYNLKTDADLYDPKTNARVMKGILDDQGLHAWTTTHGGPNSAAAKVIAKWKGEGQSVTDHPGDVVSPGDVAGGIAGAANAIAGTIGKAVLNLGVLTVAVVLLVLGVVILMGQGKASTLAKVAKVVK
jgi:hypothetical protein